MTERAHDTTDPTTAPGVEFARGAITLPDLLDKFRREGYPAELFPTEQARLRCGECGQVMAAADVGLDALRRAEGVSDPADMFAVAALRCPSCDARGTAVLNYGQEAPAQDADVLRAFDDRRQGPGISPA